MRKLKLICCVVFLNIFLNQYIQAQTSDEGASLGIKAGINISNYNLIDASAKVAPGFNVGLLSRAAFSKTFSIQPEFNINVQNSKVISHDAKFSLLMSYFEFTVSGVAQYKKFYFQLGPYISYLVNMKVSHESSNGSDLSDIINRKNFYDIDYGLVYTAGIQLKRWDIGIRYNQGLFKMGKDNTPNGNPNIYRGNKNAMLQLYSGFYF